MTSNRRTDSTARRAAAAAPGEAPDQVPDQAPGQVPARVPDRAADVMAAWRAELPDVLGPAAELTKRVLFLAADLQTATRSVLPEFGMTVGEFDVLVSLRRAGSPYRMRSNELSKSLMLSTGGTTNVVNRLADAGLVRRETDAEDGRATHVRLTEAGVARAEAVLRANAAAHDRLFAAVPADALAAATEALRALAPHLGRPGRGAA